MAADAGATTSYAYSFTAPTRTDASGAYTMAVDPFGHLTSMTDPIHGSPFTWAYGGDSQPMTAAAPNGNSTTLTYDPLGHLLTKVTGARASYTYAYNRAGNRLTEASTITGDPANGTATFGYDPLDRLTSYSLPGIRTLGDTWQAVPNRDSLTTDGIPSAQGFDAANRANTNGFAFDADGRMNTRPGTSGTWLEWDSLGRLVRVRANQGGAVVAQYTYDALDRLLTVDRSGTRIRFRYQGSSTAVAQIVDDIGGAIIRNVAVGPEGTVLEDWLGTSHRLYGTNGHHDVTWTADDTGAITATLRYDPWGNSLRSTGTLSDWRFQGSWFDSSTGLGWAIARWYDPVQGTFISEDTLLGGMDNPSSRHLYAYGAGDPANTWDPSGKFWWPWNGFIDQWNTLTPAEQSFCLNPLHWAACIGIRGRAVWANNETDRIFGVGASSRDGTIYNAFKHCIWSAACTIHEGWRDALDFTNAHEKNAKQSNQDLMMDLHNNFIGIVFVGLTTPHYYIWVGRSQQRDYAKEERHAETLCVLFAWYHVLTWYK